MTVVVCVPGQDEPWKVSNAAFRLLVAEVERLTDDSDFMAQAAALNGLHFELKTPAEQGRIAGLLAAAAHNLRRRLLSLPEPSEWELSFANHLPVLEMWMEGLEDDGVNTLGCRGRQQPYEPQPLGQQEGQHLSTMTEDVLRDLSTVQPQAGRGFLRRRPGRRRVPVWSTRVKPPWGSRQM